MQTPTFRRKQIRLPLPTYRTTYACALTIRTAGQTRPFSNSSLCLEAIDLLRRVSIRRSVAVFAYCVMPDHVHVLAQSTQGESLVDFVKEFKQRLGYRFKQRTGLSLWQKSYHDRFLRGEDDLRSAARYVFENPVRGGLVRRASGYSFSGSFVWDRTALEG